MESFKVTYILAFVIGGAFVLTTEGGPYSWMVKDEFDQVMDKMNSITPENCHHKPEGDLLLSLTSVTQVPKFNKLLTDIIFANRTKLLHLHNMALNRAMYYSYIIQYLSLANQSEYQPGFLYYYFSAAADVAANPGTINGSGIFYDNNLMYTNFYKSIRVNNTIPLFGPRAWRIEDYNDPTNWLREPTNHTIDVIDYGAGVESNYTLPGYKFNQWYKLWLPDNDKSQDSLTKYQYQISTKYSDRTGTFRNGDSFTAAKFFGPPSPGEKDTNNNMPVKFTPPYYDCGRSNKWIVSAVSPIVDHLARYHKWEHIKRNRFVAVASMDIDFLKIDINQCPVSKGNSDPNLFAGTDRCKQQTTMCEPHPGWGFQRGGYQCLCRPGFRLPFYQTLPFQGLNIEQATENEYTNGFDCLPVGRKQALPVVEGSTIVDGSRKRRSMDQRKITKEELLRNEQWFAEHLLNKKLEERRKRSAEYRSSIYTMAKDRFLSAVKPIVDQCREEFKTEKRRKRLVPRYSFNPDQKTQFLELAAPSLVDKVELRRKKRLTHNYGQQFLRTLNRAKEMENPTRKKIVARHSRKKRSINTIREAFNQEASTRMIELFARKDSITGSNCLTKNEDELHLPGNIAFGKEEFFESQSRTALRLAHFLSIFLQNIDLEERYGDLEGDHFLNKDQLFAEVVANVMADNRIFASGIYFDQDQYKNATHITEYFAPYAWRVVSDGTSSGLTFKAKDMAGLIKGKANYIFQEFYKDVKDRWASNTYGLEKFTLKPMIRTDANATSIKKFEHYPMYYRGPKLDDGHWTPPYFDCGSVGGEVKDWVMTYAVPFFGLNSLKTTLEFKGVVTVTVKLDDLDLQQCPDEFYVASAFKNTARCDYESTTCVPLPGRKFKRGGYKCVCKQGYEYPFADFAWFYDGQTMEEEFKKMQEGRKNRYFTLKCRPAGAGMVSISWLLMSLATVIGYIMQH